MISIFIRLKLYRSRAVMTRSVRVVLVEELFTYHLFIRFVLTRRLWVKCAYRTVDYRPNFYITD